ncbi:MAG: CHAD domain-containing protein [Cryobacterium sp.]
MTPAENPTPPRVHDAGAVVAFYLAGQVQVLRQQENRVLRDAPDSVHKMRVGTRRLRSVLASYGRLLQPDRITPLREELRWLAGVLGSRRDAEVLAARLRDDIARLGDERFPAAGAVDLDPARARIDAWEADVVPAAQDSVVTALHSVRYRRLTAALDDLVARPPFRARAARPARSEMRAIMTADLRRLRRGVRRARDAAEGPERDGALHEARKQAKRLRYTAEAAVPARPKRAARLVTTARELQDSLGEHQDSVVARQLLGRLRADARSEGAATAGLSRLMEHENARARDAERRFLTAWSTLPTEGG